MATSLKKVRAALEPEEPNYAAAASELGAGAIPHLQILIEGDDKMLASKAIYLASLIPDDRAPALVRAAAELDDPVLRVAAAAASRNLEPEPAGEVLIELVKDTDAGVRKVARASVPDVRSAALEELLGQETPEPIARSVPGVPQEPSLPFDRPMPGESQDTGAMPGESGGMMPGETGGRMPGE